MPIWNWDELHKDKKLDYKYLLILDDYSQDVKVSLRLNYELKKQHETFIYSLKSLNSEIFEAKKILISQIIEMFLKIFEESTDVVKLQKAQTILGALIITETPNLDWIFKVDFTETKDQKQFLTDLGIVINDYNNKVKKNNDTPDQTLNEKKAKIESILPGVHINTKTCSVLDFRAYEKEAVNKMKLTQ